MKIDQMTAHRVARALFPQLDEKDIRIMTAQQDFQAAVDNLKSVCASIATQLEGIASKLHSHPATNNDAILEGFVGDLNTMASQLNAAGGDESGAEAGSVLDDSPPTPEPAPEPVAPAGATSTAPATSDTPEDPAAAPESTGAIDTTVQGDVNLTDASTGEVIGTPAAAASTSTDPGAGAADNSDGA